MTSIPAPTFGPTLRRLRAACRLSQARLAELTDVDTSSVSRIESGTRLPSRETVQRLCAALRLDDAETAALHAAAGFVPGRLEMGRVLRQGRGARERERDELAALLSDPAVPRAVRERMRERVRAMIAYATEARQSSGEAA